MTRSTLMTIATITVLALLAFGSLHSARGGGTDPADTGIDHACTGPMPEAAETVLQDRSPLSPVAIVSDDDKGLLYVAAATAPQVIVVDRRSRFVVRRIALPGPATGITPASGGDGIHVTAGNRLVTVAGDGSVISDLPAGAGACAPVAAPDGKTLLLCNRFENQVALFDLSAGRETASLSVGREPVAAALTPDGAHLFVANHLPAGPADGAYAAAQVTVVDVAKVAVKIRISLPNGSTGLRGICLSPCGRYAFVTHILARYHLPTTQLERGWMNTNAVTVIDTKKLERLNTVLLDSVDLGAANPWGVACSDDGRLLVVAHAGGNALSAIDLPRLLEKLTSCPEAERARVPDDLSFLTTLRRRVALKGEGPRGLVLIGSEAWTADYFSNSLGTVDLQPARRSFDDTGTAALVAPRFAARSIALQRRHAETLERRGERLFNDASLCFQQWQSCASCHPDGRTDGLNWDLINDGFGNPKNTKNLLLSHRTPPSMILAVRGTAEEAVRAGFRHILFATCAPEDAAAVDAYLKAMRPVPSPFLEKGRLSAAATRGERLFESAGCASCHPGPLYTDLRSYDIGTGRGRDRERAMDTPTLVEVWRTAPYLHDGRAVTMAALLTEHNEGDRHGRTSGLTQGEISDLVEYVLSL